MLTKLLLIEDHHDIAGVIFDFFELREAYILDHANDGQQGLALASNQHYDVIIMDVMLPDIDGLSLCRMLREQGVDTPVLMLTARGTKADILEGFESGADDYLIKPFDLHILEVRVKALLRRQYGKVAIKHLEFGELKLDLNKRVLHRQSMVMTLNNISFLLLKTLMQRAPEVASREALIQAAWGDDEPDRDNLRHHIYQLRVQIDKPFAHHYIKTIPKLGYQLIAEPADNTHTE